jgi:hypothetical protein
MTINSTSKILARLVGNGTSEQFEEESQEIEHLCIAPQLKPTSEMEEILANILRPSASKKYTPMD